LGSSDPDDSDDDTIKYEQFSKEQLNKDFKFKLGMEFNSLVEFKEAIIEWNVFNSQPTGPHVSASQPTMPHVSASQPPMPHVSASQPPMNIEPVQGPSRHIAKVVYHNSHLERPFKIQNVASSNATNSVPETIVTDFYAALPASQIDSGLGPDVFDDLDDQVLAAITDQMFEAAENKLKTVNGVKNLKQQKVKTLGLKKSVKPKNCRKSSRLMKLKTQAIKGVGSSLDQPMVIEVRRGHLDS
jgi:hypothetical protein